MRVQHKRIFIFCFNTACSSDFQNGKPENVERKPF